MYVSPCVSCRVISVVHVCCGCGCGKGREETVCLLSMVTWLDLPFPLFCPFLSLCPRFLASFSHLFMKLDEPRAVRFRQPAHRDVRNQGQSVRSRGDRVERHLGAKICPLRVSGRRVVRGEAHGQGKGTVLYCTVRCERVCMHCDTAAVCRFVLV